MKNLTILATVLLTGLYAASNVTAAPVPVHEPSSEADIKAGLTGGVPMGPECPHSK